MALIGTFVAVIPYGGGRHVIFLTDPRKFAIVCVNHPPSVKQERESPTGSSLTVFD